MECNKNFWTAVIGLIVSLGIIGCSREPQMIEPGIRDEYTVERMTKLLLSPQLGAEEYYWTLYSPSGEIVDNCIEPTFLFMEGETGTWHLSLSIPESAEASSQTSLSPIEYDISILVINEATPFSPFISKVLEYCPAPGQFVNQMPEYTAGDTYSDMLRKCEEAICGENEGTVSLGGWGGYVTLGFDHTVINIPGEKDFRVWGNAIYDISPTGVESGAAEPGIVMVSYDTNCNGLPDDEWYELPGSEYNSPATVRLYSLTYFKPDLSQNPVTSDDGIYSDTRYIRWTDSQGETGYMPKNIYHRDSYWPEWVDGNALSFTGSRLAGNATDLSGNGRNFLLRPYPFGYVDNMPNDNAELNSFDISTAVDAEGNPVSLPGIDFIRIYTAMHQQCGWLGETSTEIRKVADLHLK